MTDKLQELKEQANEIGLKYSPNIGEAKLQEKLNAAIMEKAAKPTRKEVGETAEEKRVRKRKESLALVRVKVACFDPTMKKKAGTYIMASNSLVGTVRKFIQFNKPWLMPKILVNVMEESMYQAWVPGKTEFGITQMVSSMEPRYNITHMAQITPQELASIAKRQTVTESLKD